MASGQRRPRDVETRFNKAVSVVQSLPKDGPFQPSNMMKLKFYAFYKQATAGPCNIPKPGFWDVTGRAKWEAWNMAGNMPKQEAMLNYVEELQKIVETMPQSKEVEDFLRSIGPFYEEVEEPAQTDNAKDEPTDSPEPVTIDNTVTIETPVTETEENKELKSDSEEEIFSDPLVTPESLSPMLSPHHPLKSPFVNSSSEGELSDEYVVVSDQAKGSTQTPVTNTPAVTKQEGGTGNNTDHQDGTTVTIPTLMMSQEESSVVQHNARVQATGQADTMMTSQLEQVQRDLQSILHRLNSLEVLLKRRRGAENRWWLLRPFSNLSWLTLVILILWPILVNILWRKLRRYTSRLFITRH